MSDDTQKQIDEANASIHPDKNPAEQIAPDDVDEALEKNSTFNAIIGNKNPLPEEDEELKPEIADSDIPGPNPSGL